MLSCPSVVEYSALVTESNIAGNARLFLIYSHKKVSENLSLTFDFMLPIWFNSGTDYLAWQSRVCRGQMAKVVGEVQVGDCGLTAYLVRLFLSNPETGGKMLTNTGTGANYLAFDIVGDLAFGAPFGMVNAAKDFAVVPRDEKDQDSAMSGKSVAITEIPAVKILNGRGEYSMSMGVLPGWWRPYVAKLPWYTQGGQDVRTLAGIAIMAVAKRLATTTDRVDLLSKLQESRDGNGNPMGKAELTAEALTLLIAGSDTTSK